METFPSPNESVSFLAPQLFHSIRSLAYLTKRKDQISGWKVPTICRVRKLDAGVILYSPKLAY